MRYQLPVHTDVYGKDFSDKPRLYVCQVFTTQNQSRTNLQIADDIISAFLNKHLCTMYDTYVT